jgi:hypothetical protein
VRFPLDYYRILGLPIQSTPEQVEQAYRDRLQQRPHHQHSSVAITGRQQLLDKAFATLSKPALRQAYDGHFFGPMGSNSGRGQTSTPATATSTLSAASLSVSKAIGLGGRATATLPKLEIGIDIEEHQFAGAILLLHELGEYSNVIEMGTPHVQNSLSDPRSPHANLSLADADVALSVALSHLELGREQWQQGQYEAAATELETGLDLLMGEGLFASVQNQIHTDLCRLRPYRILELLAAPLEEVETREHGLAMLKGMLQERHGIDGNGNDQSGLNVEDCLKFVQQLRGYLTVREQQELFEYESQRPSPVGLYLAVYALIARGFAEHQPALLQRAERMLRQLCEYKDVHLELASCNLLLGETDIALNSLEQSQDQEMLEFIENHYTESDNLIPGLYYYTEYWLREEVFPYFRDLIDQPVNLRAYYDDEQVQKILEFLLSQSSRVVGTSHVDHRFANLGSRLGFNTAPPPPAPDLDVPLSMPSATSFGMDIVGHQNLQADAVHEAPRSSAAYNYRKNNYGSQDTRDDYWDSAQVANPSPSMNGSTNGSDPQVSLSPAWEMTDETMADLPQVPLPPVSSPTNTRSSQQRSQNSRNATARGREFQESPTLQPRYPSQPLAQAGAEPAAPRGRRRPAPQPAPATGFRLGRLQWFGLILLGILGLGGAAALARHLFLPQPEPVVLVPREVPPLGTTTPPIPGTTVNPTTNPTAAGTPMVRGSSPIAPGATVSPVGVNPLTGQPNPPNSNPNNPNSNPNIASPNISAPSVVASPGAPNSSNAPGTVPLSPGARTVPGSNSANNPNPGTLGGNTAPTASAPLTSDSASQVIRTWQQAKAKAMGKQHNSQNLESILTGPALATWRSSSQEMRSSRSHWEYQLQDIKVESVAPRTGAPTTSGAGADEMVVIARINESGNFFEPNRTTPGGSSYQKDSYRVRYVLVRREGRWLISQMRPL